LLGTVVDEWVSLKVPEARLEPGGWEGEVVFIDHFGNLLTNIPAAAVGHPLDQEKELTVGGHKLRRFRWVRSYAGAKPGMLVGLVSSTGTIEVAVNQGNAAERLRATVGTMVHVGLGRGNRATNPHG
jgi:S-adenosylmethionine hydrolase